jgi:hypothetical protein
VAPETPDPQLEIESVDEPAGAARGLASVFSLGAAGNPQIRFDPPRQVLHGPHTLRIIVDDPIAVPRDTGLRIRYHGHDVTRSFLLQARFSLTGGGSRLVAEVPWVRLSPITEHLIDVDYVRPGSERRSRVRLGPPACRAFEKATLKGFDGFKPTPELAQSIEVISREMGFNPVFTAALIAQESAFNPQSVSIARAMGLTQVTPLAEEEVTDVFSRWPRYNGSNTYPAPILKWLVMTGEINAANEWRLSPERSIRGGLLFAQRLADRWAESEYVSRINWTGGDGRASRPDGDLEVARTRLMLASYNSGYSRVTQAIGKHGPAWLLAPELKEARRYVNRIFSYCEAFERGGAPVDSRESAALDRVPALQEGLSVSYPNPAALPAARDESSRGAAP